MGIRNAMILAPAVSYLAEMITLGSSKTAISLISKSTTLQSLSNNGKLIYNKLTEIQKKYKKSLGTLRGIRDVKTSLQNGEYSNAGGQLYLLINSEGDNIAISSQNYIMESIV